jgi:hypothetical protein
MRRHRGNLPKIVFVHIPRTGGTTFASLVQPFYGDGFFRDRDTGSNFNYNFKGYLKGKYPDFDFITGHFKAIKYEHLLECDYRFITWVRNPVYRAVSTYKVLKRKNLNGGSPIEHRNLILNQLGLLEFLAQKRTRNQIWNILKGFNLDLFSFVGFTESYDKSLSRFEETFGVKLPKVKKIKNASIYNRSINENEYRILAKYNHRDMDIYNRLVEKWG